MQFNVVEPFDLVRLKQDASLYRAYALSPGHPRGPFIFVCLFADVVRYFDEVEIVEKVTDNRLDLRLMKCADSLLHAAAEYEKHCVGETEQELCSAALDYGEAKRAVNDKDLDA